VNHFTKQCWYALPKGWVKLSYPAAAICTSIRTHVHQGILVWPQTSFWKAMTVVLVPAEDHMQKQDVSILIFCMYIKYRILMKNIYYLFCFLLYRQEKEKRIFLIGYLAMYFDSFLVSEHASFHLLVYNKS
jgi:hypothetical protein